MGSIRDSCTRAQDEDESCQAVNFCSVVLLWACREMVQTRLRPAVRLRLEVKVDQVDRAGANYRSRFSARHLRAAAAAAQHLARFQLSSNSIQPICAWVSQPDRLYVYVALVS